MIPRSDIIETFWFDYLAYVSEQGDIPVEHVTEPNFWAWFIANRLEDLKDGEINLSSGIASPLPPDLMGLSDNVINPKSPSDMASQKANKLSKLKRKRNGTEGLF